MLARLKQTARSNALATRAVRSTYPALNWLRGRPAYYLRAAPYLADMEFDDVRFSNRGNEPEAHLARTRSLIDVADADVLVLGAGAGDELTLWRQQQPRSLTAVDAFSHPQQWRAQRTTRFAAMDVRTLAFRDASFDLVASTALLEHVDGVDALCDEMARVLRPGGLVFANFGPLFSTYGGAHYLGGYEHLWMSEAEFERYLVARAVPYEAQEALYWLRNGMFSRLTYDEYLAAFRHRFDVEHVTIAVSPDALRFRRTQPDAWASLTRTHAERDLLTFGATVWLRAKTRVLPMPRANERAKVAS